MYPVTVLHNHCLSLSFLEKKKQNKNKQQHLFYPQLMNYLSYVVLKLFPVSYFTKVDRTLSYVIQHFLTGFIYTIVSSLWPKLLNIPTPDLQILSLTSKSTLLYISNHPTPSDPPLQSQNIPMALYMCCTPALSYSSYTNYLSSCYSFDQWLAPLT